MQRSRLERLAPLSGVLAVALFVAGIVAFPDEIPNPDEGVAKVVDFWREHDDEATISAILFALSGIPFLWFAGSVRSALRSAEGTRGRLSAIAFGGMVVFATGLAVSAALQFALGESADDLSAGAIETLNALVYNFFFPFVVGLATLLFAVAVASFRFRAVPAAFGWVALLLGLVAMTPAGFFAFLASGLWIVALSVYLFLRGDAAAPPPTAPASSPGSPS